ncbi:MAG: chromosome segregation SMC family protein [archaeon]
MVYIEKLVMHGFKSFPRKTEIPFTPGINVILGPNGSGKSNLSDALCFVLGRLSIKSMRAAKAKNLMFLGSKVASPSKEAMVEMVFNNEDKTFTLDTNHVSIKRIVRRNGQSIYKINNQTKTRQEVLTLLAQAGIDPNGYNIILQGEIQNLVNMHAEERRKILEEVSGISIYESRKQKSLKELEKTEDKIKEILAILRERTTYLNNLEKERQQALKFKKLEKDVKTLKASIIHGDLNKKKKEAEDINQEISKKDKEIIKVKKIKQNIEATIQDFKAKIDTINKTIREATGVEQEQLNQEIANLRADLVGLSVKLENSEAKLTEISKQKQDLYESIRENDLTIKDLQKESPTIAKKQKDLETKKQELDKLEEQRKKFYMIKSELRSIKDRINDKSGVLQSYTAESDMLLRQIKNLSLELFDKRSDPKRLTELKTGLTDKQNLLANLNIKELELEKKSYAADQEINNQNKLIDKISKIDVCPVCKSKMTKVHTDSIKKEAGGRIDSLKKQIQNADREIGEIYKNKEILQQDIEQMNSEIAKRQSDILKLGNINEKTKQIQVLQEKIDDSKRELSDLEKKKKSLEKKAEDDMNIEQRYETVRVEVEEISLRTKQNLGSEISFKQRELERSKITLKQLDRTEVDLREGIAEITKNQKSKESVLTKKRIQEEKLTQKFKKLISEREGLEWKIRGGDSESLKKQNDINLIEQEINNFKIDKARVDAEIENLETEMLEFNDVEIIQKPKEALIERLEKTKDILARIGSVNLRSLEVYDEVKKEYDAINEKVEIITKEKEGILKIIHTIDIRKKKAFMQTMNSLNEIFSRNFTQLSAKGQVSLELENRKDPFEGGVTVIVKTGHGKYFDVKSLSGGEQTLVALSLIFAIQELKPYCFYMLDEIDAALDKRNSHRLASLLSKYMQQGQYIVISHNDEVITNATNLYGVSMHDGVSKVLSLKV